MIIHGNEIMEPEELTQLGAVFDETWAAVRATAGNESAELRTALASILITASPPETARPGSNEGHRAPDFPVRAARLHVEPQSRSD